MVNKRAIAMAVLSFFIFATASFADSRDNNAVKKLGRGAANIITCPFEIIKGIEDVNEESGPFAAFTWGVVSGVFKTGIRCFVGIYEVLTFPIPAPKGYKPILTDPEFFWEEAMY